MAGFGEVEAFLPGERKGFKAHVSEEVYVKAIRNKLVWFSTVFGFRHDAIKHWEVRTEDAGRASPYSADGHRQEPNIAGFMGFEIPSIYKLPVVRSIF